MHQHAGELDDIFEFRQTVETRLAALAAQRRTDGDLESIERAIIKTGRSQEWSSRFRLDMDIHRSIARAARSPRLERAMLAARADLFIPVDLARLEDRENQVHDTHTAILAAICAGDATAAAHEMGRHIELIRELTDKALAESGFSAPDR